jgi:hypothetical protein
MSRWRDARPLPTLGVTALSAATAVSMCRIFAGWGYLRPMLVVVLAVHLFAFAVRLVRLPGWLALPLTAGIVLPVLAVVYYRDSTHLLLPTGRTIELLQADLRLVWQQFPRAVAPVPGEGSFAVASALLLGLCAAVADAFAFRAFGRAEALVPTGVVFVFASALGVDRHRVVVAALWIGTALAAVALLRMAHAEDDRAWMGGVRRSLARAVPVTVTCALVAALGAGTIGPRLPGAGERALVDTRNRGDDVTEVLSPLVDIRSRLVNRSNVELFTVEADGAAYWRIAGLTEFDGSTWTPPEEDLRAAVGQLTAVSGGERFVTQSIVVRRLGGNLVPAAFTPVQLGTTGLLFADSSQTLVLPGAGLEPGDVIRVLSAVPTVTAEELRLSSASFPPNPAWAVAPAGLPDEARRLAVEVTASATTPYDQALLLQNWFRTEFTYDLTVQSGHSDDAIQNFLRIRRGYCEQFAGTFAAMARSLGLPARVAVGFTQGDLGADGRYHVYGRHAHAWAEVWFDRVGWVSFEPTPGRGEPGAEEHTGVAPAQDSTGGSGSGPATGPTDQRPVIVDESATTTTNAAGGGPPTTAPRQPTLPAGGLSDGGGPGPGTIVVVLLAGLGTWMWAMPLAVRRRAQRRRVGPAERVIAAWRAVCDGLHLAGSPPQRGATPIEYAVIAEDAIGIDHRRTAEIARCVTRAVYSPAGVDDATATRCERLSEEVSALCRDQLSWRTRLLCRLDPRLAARIPVG